MDFGDILNQWETEKKSDVKQKKQNQVSHKKANAPTKEEKENAALKIRPEEVRINPIEMWLRRYGTVDKDKEIEQYQEAKKLEDRNYLVSMAPEARIDLHGLTREEALEKLNYFVATCQSKGLRKILIVHGKGNHSTGSDPVLGEFVRRYIETDKRLGTSGHPNNREGGNGATWVIIRKK